MDRPIQIRPVENQADWAEARAIRQAVFVEEQNCPPEEEFDEYDNSSRHYVGRIGTRAVAAARWRETVYENRKAAKLERFAILGGFRGRGIGRQLIRYTLSEARSAGHDLFVLAAQAHLTDLYASLGFKPVGETYVEVGILHQFMVLDEKSEA